MLVGGGQDNLCIIVCRGFAGIFPKVQHNLDQVVLIAKNRGQGGVVLFNELHVLAKTVLGQLADMFQNLVDIDGFALDRAAI